MPAITPRLVPKKYPHKTIGSMENTVTVPPYGISKSFSIPRPVASATIKAESVTAFVSARLFFCAYVGINMKRKNTAIMLMVRI